MASTLTDRLNGIPRKPLAMRGEGLHKKVVDPESRALVARAIALALGHSGLNGKEAAFEMGYGDDQSPISRWVAGVEPPQMARFLSVPELRYGLSVALAEMSDGAEVKTIVTFPARRRA